VYVVLAGLVSTGDVTGFVTGLLSLLREQLNTNRTLVIIAKQVVLGITIYYLNEYFLIFWFSSQRSYPPWYSKF
jgi:hypothetical protein